MVLGRVNAVHAHGVDTELLEVGQVSGAVVLARERVDVGVGLGEAAAGDTSERSWRREPAKAEVLTAPHCPKSAGRDCPGAGTRLPGRSAETGISIKRLTLMKKRSPLSSYRYFPVRVIGGRAAASGRRPATRVLKSSMLAGACAVRACLRPFQSGKRRGI